MSDHIEEAQGSKNQSYLLLWIVPFIISCFSLLMILSVTGTRITGTGSTNLSIVMRQAVWFFAGLFAMIIVSIVPVRIWKRYSALMWIFGFLLTCATLTGFFGSAAGGAERWIRLWHIRVQPLELLVMAIVLHLSKVLSRDEKLPVRSSFLKTCVIAVVSVIPLLLQPDMGGAILVFVITMAIFVMAKGWFYPLSFGFLAIPPFLYLIFREGYRIRRYLAFTDPWREPLDSGYQVIQGLIAFANGGLLGRGIGKGFQKMRYLPAAHTDYIFASVGEEFGLLGTSLILFLFLAWTLSIFRFYLRLTDEYDILLLWGLSISILLPLFINLAGITKLLPLTGMPIPFLSYGGSSMLFSWIKVGVIISIVKKTRFDVS